jgi:hypothetical protein
MLISPVVIAGALLATVPPELSGWLESLNADFMISSRAPC